MKNLAPSIYRQRLIIEGVTSRQLAGREVEAYLSRLSVLLRMRAVWGPKTRDNPQYGVSGYIYWEESGCHFYFWRKPFPFFSVDLYTCKKFDPRKAVAFTRKFFRSEQIVSKSV